MEVLVLKRPLNKYVVAAVPDGPGLSHLVLELALFGFSAAATRAVGEVAVEDGGGVDLGGEQGWQLLGRLYLGQRLGVPSPRYQLLGGHKVDVRQGQDRVNELQEALLAVSTVEEPGSVEEEREGSFALGVVFQEVLSENLLD